MQARLTRRSSGLSGWRRVAGALLALATAVLVVSVAWAGFVAQLPPAAVAVLPDGARLGTVADLRGRITREGNPVPGRDGNLTAEELRRFNARLPLNPLPYTAGGMAAFERGDAKAGLGLLEAARLQDPRSRPVRLTLARIYLEDGQVDRAASELFSSAALFEQDSRLIMATIRAGSLNPRFREAIVRLVEQQPGRAAVLYRLITYDDALGDPLVLDLIRRFPPGGSNARRIMPMLVKRGALPEALAIWRAEQGMAADARLAWPQDPGFARKFGTGVFEWRDRTARLGRVAVVEDSRFTGRRALSVAFSGNGLENVLSQQTALAPGTYGWQVRYHKETWLGPDTELVWELACLGGEVLATARLTDAAQESGRLRLDATVPAGCPVQEFRLRASGNQASRETDVRFGPIEPLAGGQ